ncbi:PREDICTED: CLAVATA3/ESR (CLE)-related protein 21-like [Camelina sativa]|uniref:CLAVATA3/ESR (CLE)-related protein 21-like n=1 Tax=Camelina sativa TaxID=90675 RepID=A0ABM0XDF5_CAMSA|nr:PREDICTED: CLAVATA3/ESR (CLE)-related protein 21-like [Camelina sativa]
MLILSSRYAMKRDVVIIVITILVLIIFSRSSSIQAGRFSGTRRNDSYLSVARSQQYYKNHHEFVVIKGMSNFNKFRRRSSKVRRKIDGGDEEDQEEKRSIPTGPNPLHNK